MSFEFANEICDGIELSPDVADKLFSTEFRGTKRGGFAYDKQKKQQRDKHRNTQPRLDVDRFFPGPYIGPCDRS